MDMTLQLNDLNKNLLVKPKNPQYLIENNKIQFTNKCKDEVIEVIKIIKNTKGLLELFFERRADYDKIFIGLKHHDIYFKNMEQNIHAKMVMILESPHIKEFYTPGVMNYDKKQVCSRPANGVNTKTGDTGKNIDMYVHLSDQDSIQEILDIANIDISDSHYNNSVFLSFSLINAIQYQCSLGVATKHYRDEVFTKLWENQGIRDDFKERVQEFSPNVIINSCTQGDLKEEEMIHFLKYYNGNNSDGQIADLMNDIILKTKIKKDSSLQGLLTKILESQEYSVNFKTSHPCSWSRIQNYKFHLK